MEVGIVRISRERFVAAMARLDITGNDLAELAGVSRGTVTAVKSGKSCSTQTASKLAAILGSEIIVEGRICRDAILENS